jgi:glycolate oxidase FAD binding subunit
MAVLLEGDPDGTAERAGLLCSLLGGAAAAGPSPPAWWGWPAGGDGRTGADGQPGAGEPWQTGTLIRIAFWAAGLPRVLRLIDAAAQAAGLDPAVGGSAAAGVIYAGTGPEADPAAVAAFVAGLRAALARGDADARPATAPAPDSPPVLASAVVVHAPPGVRDLVDPWGPVPSLPLMRAVKDQFDPGHRMAPGRFAGGI